MFNACNTHLDQALHPCLCDKKIYQIKNQLGILTIIMYKMYFKNEKNSIHLQMVFI